jgi:hypothetical protein
VLEIDLNGVDGENVDVELQSRNDLIMKIEQDSFHKRTTIKRGVLKVDSFWAGYFPKEYNISIKVSQEKRLKNGRWNRSFQDTFQVTKSKPELRLDVLNDGTKDYITKEHGIHVNASGSFDPDGTDLKYIWKYGAEPTKPDNTTAKFWAYDRAASIVEDEYELRTKRNFNFLDYFVPDIAAKNITTDGPYYANDTVRIAVETEPYHFSKQTYYDDFSLGLAVAGPEATVTRWEVVDAPDSSHSEPTEDAYKYVGVIEVPAVELSSRKSAVTVYNVNNTRKEVQTTLPTVEVLLKNEKYWTDVSLKNLTYLVEKPNIRKTTVNSEERRDRYLADGYHVKTMENDTKYILEEFVKTRDAKYEKVTRRFSNRRIRNQFLDSMQEWYVDGTVREEETRTRTFSSWFDSATTRSPRKWHDSSLWNGEQTGATREVKVEDAEYETEREYEYEYEVEKTRTKTVRRCSLKFGCHTETVTKTYTVTRTSTYWATFSYGYDHDFTGDTRQVKVEDAEYETQFEVRYKTKSTEQVTYYKVARDKQVQKAEYDWESQASTMDYVVARKQASGRSDWRITEEPITAWVLVRNDGTSTFWTDAYVNRSHITETKATITGQFTQELYNSKTDNITKETEYRTTQRTYPGAESRNSIIENITSKGDSTEWCKIKASCSETNGGV